MTEDNNEKSHHFILISSYESITNNRQEYGTEENYNMFSMSYNLIHEIGHALSRQHKGPLKCKKECLDDEMLANNLSAAFWKKYNADLYNDIQDKNRESLEEAKQKCSFLSGKDEDILKFFLHQSRMVGSRFILTGQENRYEYYDLLQIFLINASARTTSPLDDLCENEFSITIHDSKNDLLISDFSNDISLVKTICDFCKKIEYWVPLSAYILDKEGFNCYCNDFNENLYRNCIKYKYT